MIRDLLKKGRKGNFFLDEGVPNVFSQSYKDSVGQHINVIFTDELFLFIPAFIIISLMVWFFNDKIKAR
jgi:hypothetical protein